ncbi:hypothetical protein AGMMS50256_03080 [Betaproteobacteria bacterium]|nr:hypothetical protein AGMMS50256_03080 [Betaproteobacteria bacterium]
MDLYHKAAEQGNPEALEFLESMAAETDHPEAGIFSGQIKDKTWH